MSKATGTQRRARRRRIILAAVLAPPVLLVAALLFFRMYLGTAKPQIDGTVDVAGLSAPVEIARDSLGVPHIFAQSEHDLLFAQGWAHAQDRLWQMELFRRVCEGRLAEVMGAALVETDRFLRTIGYWRTAGEQLRQLSSDLLQALEAYAAGVNAFLEQRRGALPPELLLLDIEPEPWTPRHVLAIERLMAWDLSAWWISSAATEAALKLGAERAQRLLPAYPEWGPTIIDMPAVPEIPAMAARLLDAASFTRASNSWVVAGTRTRSGKPILANDMHLALRAPSLWYLMALHADSLAVTGMTLPGVPYVIAGHNRAVAWGFTNASLDDLDFFVERLDPADSARYLTPDGSAAFDIIEDSIRVKGQPAVPIRIRISRHGPILEDFGDPEQRGPVAMRWAGNDVSQTIAAVPALNRATNANEILAAVRLFDNPHQNVVFADTAGTIGYVMGGRIPVRGNGRTPPVLPVPGWTGEWDWTGWLPFEEHPQVLNPEEGFIVTANHRQIEDASALRISTYWEQPYRAQRIREMILQAGPLDADAVHAMQLDVRDALAQRYHAVAVEFATAAGLHDAARILESWDLRAARDSRGAALFYAWYESLNRGIARHIYGEQPGALARGTLDGMLDRRQLPWDDPDGNAFQRLAREAALAADSLASGRTWGELHEVYAEHQLASVALLERLLRLNVGGEGGDGSPTTVNVSDFPTGELPVRAAYGPSQRHVADLGDLDGIGGFILPTGQSGLPFDRHYRDQWGRWRDGGLWRIPLERNAARERIVHRLTLQPWRTSS